MPFQSPNYTQTPNDLFDDMLPDMGEAELKVTLALVRNTFGYHRASFRMSLSDMAKVTGLSRQGVLDGATAAEKRGTFARDTGNGVTEWALSIEEGGQPSRPVLVNPVDQSEGVTGQPSRPPSNKESSKEREKESASTTRAIQDCYVKLLGYKPDNWAEGEAKAAKNISEKWTPDQLEQAYRHFKSQPFYKDKRLTLRYLNQQMPELFKNGNGNGRKNSEPDEQTRLDFEEWQRAHDNHS